MHINLFLIPFVIILGLLMGDSDSSKRRRWYIIVCSAILVFVAAMRNPEWMEFRYSIDALVYKNMFEQSIDMSWDEIWTAVVGRYVGANDEFDIGFIGLQKLIGIFTHDFYIYSLIADLLFIVPFGIILYRYSISMKQLIFAFIYYIALIQIYLFGGARQIFAMGFDLMALLATIDRKKISTIFFFTIGLTIHFSSFLFAVPLLMIWFNASPKVLKRLHILCFVLFPIVFMMPNQIILFMGEASGVEKYTEYGKNAIQGGANTFIFLIELMSLFCLVAIKRKDIAQSKYLQSFYVMIPLFTLFAPLIRSNGSMIRIALYYSIFLTLLIPYAIECYFRKNEKFEKTFAYFIAIGSLALLTISDGGITYYFFGNKKEV